MVYIDEVKNRKYSSCIPYRKVREKQLEKLKFWERTFHGNTLFLKSSNALQSTALVLIVTPLCLAPLIGRGFVLRATTALVHHTVAHLAKPHIRGVIDTPGELLEEWFPDTHEKLAEDYLEVVNAENYWEISEAIEHSDYPLVLESALKSAFQKRDGKLPTSLRPEIAKLNRAIEVLGQREMGVNLFTAIVIPELTAYACSWLPSSASSGAWVTQLAISYGISLAIGNLVEMPFSGHLQALLEEQTNCEEAAISKLKELKGRLSLEECLGIARSEHAELLRRAFLPEEALCNEKKGKTAWLVGHLPNFSFTWDLLASGVGLGELRALGLAGLLEIGKRKIF